MRPPVTETTVSIFFFQSETAEGIEIENVQENIMKYDKAEDQKTSMKM
jgi:hypothetical protein